MFARIDDDKARQASAAARARIAADRRRAGLIAWTPATHARFGPQFQRVIVTLFMLQLRHPATGKPRFPRAHFCDLHVDVFEHIIGFL